MRFVRADIPTEKSHMDMRTTKIVAVVVIAVIVAASAAAFVLLTNEETVVLKVYTAGSLSEPFTDMEGGGDLETIFEESHKGVDVQVTSGGSADMIRRVIGLNQTCDVPAVADLARLEVVRAFEKSERAPSLNTPLIDRESDFTGYA